MPILRTADGGKRRAEYGLHEGDDQFKSITYKWRCRVNCSTALCLTPFDMLSALQALICRKPLLDKQLHCSWTCLDVQVTTM